MYILRLIGGLKLFNSVDKNMLILITMQKEVLMAPSRFRNATQSI